MKSNSNLIGTSVFFAAVCLNALGWFWTNDRLELIELTVGIQGPRNVPAELVEDTEPSAETSLKPSVGESQLARETAHEFDIPGVSAPMLYPADQVKLSDEDRVIGVVVDNEPRAYVLDAFAVRGMQRKEDVGVHIVNDYFGSRPICVTHCDRTHSTRVLTTKRPDPTAVGPIDLRVGGWTKGMLLVIDGRRYEHHSDELPLADVEYVTTTWGKWRADHPETLVYTGF